MREKRPTGVLNVLFIIEHYLCLAFYGIAHKRYEKSRNGTQTTELMDVVYTLFMLDIHITWLICRKIFSDVKCQRPF